MDETDVAPSPDWGPARSGISRGLQSSGTSSSNLSSLRNISDALKSGWYSNDKPEIVEIHPYETTKCTQLILTIQKAERLQSVLQTAIDILQRHAKWFTQEGLEALIQHTLSKANESTSTADLEVALDLVDTIITFSVLPRACLLPVVKFICIAYHNGTRMHKHKSLATKAWHLYQHILRSHLGCLSIDTLLEVLAKEETQWSRSSFAAVTGALRLLDEKFSIGGTTNPTTNAVLLSELLLSLRNVISDGDDILKEQVIALLYKCISSNDTLVDVDALACWPVIIELVEQCGIAANDEAGQLFLGQLAKVTLQTEPSQQLRLSSIFLLARHPLPQHVAEQLLTPIKVVNRMENNGNDTTAKHDTLLAAFSHDSHYRAELTHIAQEDLEFLRFSDKRNEWTDYIKRYMKLASSGRVCKESAITCVTVICALFHSALKTSFNTAQLWKVNLTFDSLTKLAVSAPHPEARLCAFRALAQLRVTISGYVYLEQDDTAEPPFCAGTAPGAVMLSHLPRKMWLDEVLTLVRQPETEELTSAFVLKSLPAQLSNLLFFVDQKELVRAIYEISISKLKTANNSSATYYVRILTALLNYRGLFTPSEERIMVDLFIKRAGSSEVVSKDCVHALTLCCHELPESVMRELDNVIQKMAQMVTQKHMTIHVLEFLTGLSRLPKLFHNFRPDDFKKIFGVSISYLHSLRAGHMSRQSAAVSSDTESGSHQATHEILPQYVYSLAHHVMIFWYIALRPDDRPVIKSYVTNALCYKHERGRDVPDDQGLVVIDFMERVDTENTAHTRPRALANGDLSEMFDEVDGKILTQHRICGLVLISTHTSLRTAKTLVTTRRPSGTAKYLVFGRNPVTRESWTSTGVSAAPPSIWSGSAGEDETMTIYSDDPDGSAYGAVAVPNSASPLGSGEIITLPEDSALDRAIQVFDRTPGLDSHKAGVIYIGEGQTQEDDILANSSGSPDYRDIVENLGNLQKLKGAKFNTQGLDTRDDTDGRHVIVWNNEITELVFHVTTMMPTDINEKHMSAIRKKAHIGNDHVNIIFNNSGMPFKFDTFPSQFNYVYIVITPSVRTTFLQTRTHEINTSEKNRYYRIEVMTRAEFPTISSAAEPRMISGTSLPGYVRNLALNACVFSEVWVNRESEEYRSSWQTRLNQIRRLRDRYASDGASASKPSSIVSKGKGKSSFWK